MVQSFDITYSAWTYSRLRSRVSSLMLTRDETVCRLVKVADRPNGSYQENARILKKLGQLSQDAKINGRYIAIPELRHKQIFILNLKNISNALFCL